MISLTCTLRYIFKKLTIISSISKRIMSSSVGDFDPLDPKYGVDLNKYPNDNELTWSYPAEKDGYGRINIAFYSN